MYKRLLPIFLTFVLFSCNKPASESTAAETIADTVSQGNTDGDYFVPNADSVTPQDDEVIEEMIDTHSPTIDVCGFSDDGKYFAFTQVLTGEGDEGKDGLADSIVAAAKLTKVDSELFGGEGLDITPDTPVPDSEQGSKMDSTPVGRKPVGKPTILKKTGSGRK